MRGVKAWVKALLILLLGVAANSGAQSLLTQAEQAHARYDLAAEMKLLEAAAGSASDEDRAEAERRLAWLAWRFYKDDQAARKHFEKAESIDFGLAERWPHARRWRRPAVASKRPGGLRGALSTTPGKRARGTMPGLRSPPRPSKKRLQPASPRRLAKPST